MNKVSLFVVLLFVLLAGHAFGQIPRELYYENYYQETGSNVNGDIDLVIRIYTNATEGDYLYEDSDIVTVIDGSYSTRIGDNTTYGSLSNALASGHAYLDITINGTNLPPREQILPEAYALKAAGVPDNAITASMIADSAIQSRHIDYGAVGADQLAADAVTSDKIADNAISTNDLNISQLDARYVTSQQAVTTTPASLVYSNDFSSDPFAEKWICNSNVWWEDGCIKELVPNGSATFSNASMYRDCGYELFVTTTTNSNSSGFYVSVYRNNELVKSVYCSALAGVHSFGWTSVWNRVEIRGCGGPSPLYLYVTEFRVNESASFQAGTTFANDLYANVLRVDSLLEVTSITSPSPQNSPSKTIRLASGTPATSWCSGDVIIETGSGQYSTIPGSILLKPGSNPSYSTSVGGSIDLYMGSGGNTNRTKDGAIRFFGVVSNGVSKQVAILDSMGNWSMTGTVSAVSFTGNGSGLAGIAGGSISAGSISSTQLAANAVTSDKLAADVWATNDDRYVNTTGDTMAGLEMAGQGGPLVTTAIDTSPYFGHGTFSNGATVSNGFVNLRGTNDLIIAPDAVQLRLTNAYTIIVRAKVNLNAIPSNNWGMLASKHSFLSHGYQFYLERAGVPANQFRVGTSAFTNNGMVGFIGSVNEPISTYDEQWISYAAKMDVRAGVVDVFLNGTKVSNDGRRSVNTNGEIAVANGDMWLGDSPNTGLGSENLLCEYDYAYIFNRALSDADIASVHSGGLSSISQAGLVLRLDFNGLDNATLVVRPDASQGYENPLVVQSANGSPALAVAGNGVVSMSSNLTVGGNLTVSGRVTAAAVSTLDYTNPKNFVQGTNSICIGGESNVITGSWSVIAGGLNNTVTADKATIGGGVGNAVGKNYGVVGGGANNTASGTVATVAGGSSCAALGDFSSVGGGLMNSASGTYSSIGGGSYNSAFGAYSSVGGGTFNSAPSTYSSVGGGNRNSATGPYAVVAGGYQNTAGGACYVGGGAYNVASTGQYASVPGGKYNRALGNYSFAAGYKAYAANTGAFVWADSSEDAFFNSAGDHTFNVRARGGAFFDGNVSATGTIAATSFSGDGSGLTGVNASALGGYSASNFASADVVAQKMWVTGGMVTVGSDFSVLAGFDSEFSVSLLRVGDQGTFDFICGEEGVDEDNMHIKMRWNLVPDNPAAPSIDLKPYLGASLRGLYQSDRWWTDGRFYATNSGKISEFYGVKVVDRTGLDADLLDGQHASAFSSTNNLTNYVKRTGDTMTGPLTNVAGFFGDGSGLTNLNAIVTENDPVWNAEKASYATGTPVYAETDPQFATWLITNQTVVAETDPVAQTQVWSSVQYPAALLTDGARPLSGNLDMGSNRIVQVASPVNDGDAVNKAFLRSVLSYLPPQGDISMGAYTNGAVGNPPLTF